MKLNEIRNLSLGDFDQEVTARKKELMELRFQGAIGQLANPARVRTLRKEIAQLLTVKTEKQRQESGQ
ncbi:50S ribosomal protein L29 [Deinococcus peraridilitoris]|uniref:Large ribosomal subunit protein uL29 n=1 Tax=Deinococcus peraridilitoris (strain DSM 19664 / LMG 22246 / CIP 109416 / KR-200) TaxID=937777 RepID=L0A4Y5_DEIPD|nr:50S ribosomal protein L29 [Deinococcus peraridilitoris]AFZ68494.1 ribosomal protein L29 [Deinococcus peraridilitoris DSM 19664]